MEPITTDANGPCSCSTRSIEPRIHFSLAGATRPGVDRPDPQNLHRQSRSIGWYVKCGCVSHNSTATNCARARSRRYGAAREASSDSRRLIPLYLYRSFPRSASAFAVRRYCCRLLFGRFGIVISTKPLCNAGIRYFALKWSSCRRPNACWICTRLIGPSSASTSRSTSPLTSPVTSPVIFGVWSGGNCQVARRSVVRPDVSRRFTRHR